MAIDQQRTHHVRFILMQLCCDCLLFMAYEVVVISYLLQWDGWMDEWRLLGLASFMSSVASAIHQPRQCRVDEIARLSTLSTLRIVCIRIANLAWKV